MMTARFMGALALHAKLQKMERATESNLQSALMKAAQPIRDEAEVLCPVSEGPGGHLAKGIKIRPAKSDNPNGAAVRIGVKEGLWYGVFPEYGTSKMAAQPFMRPALDTKKDEALDILKDELGRSAS